MRDINYFNNISIGQYIDVESPIHRLTPRIKYVILFGLVFLILSAPTFFGAFVGIIAAIMLQALSKLPISHMLRSLKPLIFLGLLSLVMQFLFKWPGDRSSDILRIGSLKVSWYELTIVASILARAAGMILALGWFTSVITEYEAADEIDHFIGTVLRNSQIAHKASLIAATTIKFVPIVAGELEDIVKAQASRGATFGSESLHPLAKARNYLPLFVPVTIRALERAEILAEAMEARCYGGKKNPLPPSPIGRKEKMIAAGILGAVAGVWLIDFYVAKPWIRP